MDIEPLGLGLENGEAIYNGSQAHMSMAFGKLDEAYRTAAHLIEIAMVDQLCERRGITQRF